jgi:predicted AAA+ superfamily ATPase
VREHAIDDPEGFLAALGDGGAFIDEVQRAPDLLLAIKAIVDREQRPGRYILSGSNQPKVSAAVSDSLLGRVANRTLRPFTLSELRYDEYHPGWSFLFDDNDQAVQDELVLRGASSGALEWRDVVTAGGFPRAVAAPADYRERLLNDYVTTFSNQDIRELIAVDSGVRFENFLRLLAARSGQELNYSRIANTQAPGDDQALGRCPAAGIHSGTRPGLVKKRKRARDQGAKGVFGRLRACHCRRT